jgi:holliday junction DNA helicase RuvA
MISFLRGHLTSKSPTDVVVDVHGVGYAIHIPLSTFETLGSVGSEVTVHTYLHVREDALQLYGFATEAEREMFRMLISVTGIGPKMAQGILSGMGVNDIRQHIAQGNFTALTAIPGVGRKLAERLIVELREKISSVEPGASIVTGASEQQQHVRAEALLALTSLGYTRTAAEKALRAAILEAANADVTVEVLIKSSLRHASR